jgi:hypothetical protein
VSSMDKGRTRVVTHCAHFRQASLVSSASDLVTLICIFLLSAHANHMIICNFVHNSV